MNQCFVQLCGPFEAGQDLVSLLKKSFTFTTVVKLGVQSKTGNKCRVNGQEIEIGKTEIYEISDVDVESVVFLQDEKASTIVDFMVE